MASTTKPPVKTAVKAVTIATDLQETRKRLESILEQAKELRGYL